jgi:SAM-dependent methyltransferase
MTFALSRTLRASDFDDERVVALMRDVVPGEAAQQHRKTWEFAIALLTLDAGGVLTENAVGLSVAAGHEAILFYLANRCRQIFATDVYDLADPYFSEAAGSMLTDPDTYAPYPYRRGRLVVSWMDALDLRFETGTFDFVISLGSIEHFGALDGAARALSEMARVVRPGGIVFVTTEQALDGRRQPRLRDTWLFDPDELLALVDDTPELELFGGVDYTREQSPPLPLVESVRHSQLGPAGVETRPHFGLRAEVNPVTREFTSVSLALRKVAE